MAIQPRYLRNPDGGWGAPVMPAVASEYAAILTRYAARLLAFDGTLQLIAANGGPNMSVRTAFADHIAANWHRPALSRVSSMLWGSSFHLYMRQPNRWDPQTMSWAARLPGRKALATLRYFRDLLEAARLAGGAAHAPAISIDEWSIGPPWSTEAWGAPHALYAASFVSMLVRHARSLGIGAANYYSPINEGAIAVGPWSASLTPLGEVLALYSRHQGGHLVETELSNRSALRAPGPHGDDDLDALASLDEAAVENPKGHAEFCAKAGAGAARLLLTVANRNSGSARRLQLCWVSRLPTGVELYSWPRTLPVTVLHAAGIDPVEGRRVGEVGTLHRTAQVLHVAGLAGSTLDSCGVHAWHASLDVPAFSVVQVYLPVC